jgi:TolB-like protein
MHGDLGTLTYRAVDLMLASAPEVKGDTPLIVASVSDVENMDKSSALGNIVSDMIRTRLAQDGHTASEVRLRSAISFYKGEGEFMLSRNKRALMPAPSAAAVVTGTYAADTDMLYVSLKLVSASDAHIISGADFAVPLQNVWKLLHQHEA